MNISIFASIWCQNLWDELILKNEILLLEKDLLSFWIPTAKKWINFRVFTYNLKDIFFEKENIRYLSFFPNGIREIKNIFRNIDGYLSFVSSVFWSNYIIVGWGGLFYDSELQISKSNLDLWLWRKKYFKFFGKKVIFYWVSIDIQKSESAEKIKEIFMGAYRIFVRDTYSANILKALDIDSEVVLDPVFYDNGDFTPDKKLVLASIASKSFRPEMLENIDVSWKIIGVALRKWYFSKFEHLEKLMVAEFIHFLLEKWAREILLIPHSFHIIDNDANDRVFLENFVSDKVVIAWEDIKEVYSVYKEKRIDMCISMRLHSIILSAVYKIPFVSLSYAKKTEEIMKMLK